MNSGERIKQLRTEKNLTQNELADLLFVSRELVSKWEGNLRRPDEKSAEKMAEIFSVSVDDIIDKNKDILDELSDCFPSLSEDKFQGELINGFLATVSLRDRCIFLRRYYYFDEIPDIAYEYGLSKPYIRTVLSRLRKKLKNYSRERML